MIKADNCRHEVKLSVKVITFSALTQSTLFNCKRCSKTKSAIIEVQSKYVRLLIPRLNNQWSITDFYFNFKY